MNKAIINGGYAGSQEEITGHLISGIEEMLRIINKDSIPPVRECLELQNLFRIYIECLSRENKPGEELGHKQSGIRVDFKDVSADGLKSSSIIADLMSDPSLITSLYVISLRKLVIEDELPIDENKRKWLTDQGYITHLTVSGEHEAQKFIVLTSKGWLCFQKKTIAQQLRKRYGLETLFLPEWLAASQIKWIPETFHRALVCREYFKQNSNCEDYMIFSFPENEQLLFGCESNVEQDIVYICAVTEKAPFTENELDTLKKVISNVNVNRVILATSNVENGQLLIRKLKLSTDVAEKVTVFVMEERNE